MPAHIALKLIGTLIVFMLGNSFPAWANSNEKDPKGCEEGLTTGSVGPVALIRWRVRIMPVGGDPANAEMSEPEYKFKGPRDSEMVAWAETTGGDGQAAVKLARADSMGTPAFSFPLESGETILRYRARTGSAADGLLSVRTSRRILLFRFSLN